MFSVPVVPPDLRHEETIIQSINALERLQVTISGIFDRIDSRVDRNNAKIEEIQARIALASNKISSLTGINKAIKIFSPAKFPASHVFRNIPQTFDVVHQAEEITSLKEDYHIESSQDPISHRSIQEKLVFYHVRGNSEKSKLSRIIDNKKGLGLVSPNITSVNSLLIYNGANNVYEQSPDMNLLRKEGIRWKQNQNSEESSTQKIDAAPLSISQRQKADKKFNQGLFYTPKLNDAPEINVPIDLPDLPGIADDVIFEITESEKIAPSLYIENLPELPEPEAIQEKENIEASRDIPDKSQPKESAAKTAIPPPPPPPPPSQQLPLQNEAAGIVRAQPPPPPPPPLPPTLLTSETSVESNKSRPKVSMPDANDARSNLMEAIRKAGGARGGKLRAAAEVVRTNEPQSSGKQNKPTGDLMADLHNKLSMRRKGISGAKEAEENQPGGSGTVIGRLSALIPPPPPSQAQANSSTTDASDEDDWAD